MQRIMSPMIDPNTIDNNQRKKHQRIKEFAKVIQTREKVEYKSFLAEMQWTGLRKKVAEEYIEALKDLQVIEIEKGLIIWTEEKK